jgi:hypothetical protein
MEYTYTKIEPTDFDKGMIVRVDAQALTWYIPIDPANSDYQAYLKSLEENK